MIYEANGVHFKVEKSGGRFFAVEVDKDGKSRSRYLCNDGVWKVWLDGVNSGNVFYRSRTGLLKTAGLEEWRCQLISVLEDEYGLTGIKQVSEMQFNVNIPTANTEIMLDLFRKILNLCEQVPDIQVWRNGANFLLKLNTKAVEELVGSPVMTQEEFQKMTPGPYRANLLGTSHSVTCFIFKEEGKNRVVWESGIQSDELKDCIDLTSLA